MFALVGDAHGAVKMDGAAADRYGAVARARFRGENGEVRRFVVAALAGLDRVDDGCAGEFGVRPHFDEPMLDRLEAGVSLPSARALAKVNRADDLLAPAIAQARLALAAELAGLACRAVEITIGYTKTRVQFGKPIASFQAIQHRLVEMWSDAEFACAAVVNAIEAGERGDDKAANLAILAAKARAGDSAVSICRRAIHLHGAMGITDESDIGLYLKRALALNATLGQPEALRLQFLALERAA